jgi:hypothetical protein
MSVKCISKKLFILREDIHMSNILNTIKQVIGSSIKVEVKAPVVRNGKNRFPVIVTDMGQSFTSGWFVQYNPVAQENNTQLYDGSESFSELHIARFSQLHDLILTANYYFLQGNGVENLIGGRKRAIYEPNGAIRLTVTSQSKSTSVVVTIVDESSPLHMMSIPFTVCHSNTGDGSFYVLGTEKYWDRNTDTLQEFNANFAPRKGRFYRVQQQQNQPATLKAKIAVNNGQYQIGPDGTFAVDTNASSPEYITVITNEYKALAYIYEQALMTKAFEMAIAQGLPVSAPASAPGTQPQAPSSGGFTPAFALPMGGQPNPVQQPPVQPQVNHQQSTPQAPHQPEPQIPVGAGASQGGSVDGLPWGQN